MSIATDTRAFTWLSLADYKNTEHHLGQPMLVNYEAADHRAGKTATPLDAVLRLSASVA